MLSWTKHRLIFGLITTSHSSSPIHLAASFCLFPTPAAPHIFLTSPGSYDGWLLRITVTLHGSLCCCLGSVLHTPARALLLSHSGPGNRQEDCELQCQLAGTGTWTSSLHWTFNYLHFSVSTLILLPVQCEPSPPHFFHNVQVMLSPPSSRTLMLLKKPGDIDIHFREGITWGTKNERIFKWVKTNHYKFTGTRE